MESRTPRTLIELIGGPITQYDNVHQPQVSCNVTALSMLIGKQNGFEYDKTKKSFITPKSLEAAYNISSPQFEDFLYLAMESDVFQCDKVVLDFFAKNRWAQSCRIQTVHGLLCYLANSIQFILGSTPRFYHVSNRNSIREIFEMNEQFGGNRLPLAAMLSIATQKVAAHLVAVFPIENGGEFYFCDPAGTSIAEPGVDHDCILESASGKGIFSSGDASCLTPAGLRRTKGNGLMAIVMA